MIGVFNSPLSQRLPTRKVAIQTGVKHTRHLSSVVYADVMGS